MRKGVFSRYGLIVPPSFPLPTMHNTLSAVGCETDANEEESPLDSRGLQTDHDRRRVLRARIVEIRHQGAVVCLPDGERAWLPAVELIREIKPHQDLSKQTHFREGDELAVVVCGQVVRDMRLRKVVSHVRVHDDPWNEVAGWPDRAVKVMDVELVTKTLAHGHIPPGIRAKALLDSVMEVFPPHWHDFATIRPGDKLAGFVTAEGIDQEERVVTLDVRSFIESGMRVDEALSPGLFSGTSEAVAIGADHTPVQSGAGIDTAIRRLMVVDDDESFLEDVKEFLDKYGCDVATLSRVHEVCARLDGEAEPPDLMLMDLHFPPHPPFEGLRVASQVQTQWPDIPLVVVTADDTFFADTAILAQSSFSELKVCEVILKPIGRHELLRALGAGTKGPRRLVDIIRGAQVEERPSSKVRDSWQTKLREVLRSLEQDTQADAVVLFSIRPISMSVRIVAAADASGLVRFVKRNIERSPIRDVAIDEEELVTGDAASYPAFRKHRWLQRAYGYASCVGVPVHVPSEYAYSLFAFDRRRQHFSVSLLPRMHRAARELANILYAQRIEERLFSVEPYELLGRAYGSMAHDLRHALSTELTTKRLVQMLAGKTSMSGSDLESVREQVASLDERLHQAAAIARTFQQVARGAEEQEQEVELLPLVASYVDDFSRQFRVLRREVVSAEAFPVHCCARVRAMGLRQVLFNLVLNAIQQIEFFSLRQFSPGEVLVELGHEEAEDGAWACIRVHDTGPGIHRADFEKVFELGYTTKSEGFGMGLDICRRVAGKVDLDGRRGDVVVRRSILFVGTTFEIRLPILSKKEW